MNEERIKVLLNAGYSISEVADEVEVEAKNLYHFAKKHNLPYNAPIKDGGPKEKRILRLINSGFSPKDIGLIFKIAPRIIEKIASKAKKPK
jgi:DNA-binding CsgD family transcriptional regulator